MIWLTCIMNNEIYRIFIISYKYKIKEIEKEICDKNSDLLS